jgi:hypothetical protein
METITVHRSLSTATHRDVDFAEHATLFAWIATAQGRQDSNLQPAVLETAALPIAPLPFGLESP